MRQELADLETKIPSSGALGAARWLTDLSRIDITEPGAGAEFGRLQHAVEAETSIWASLTSRDPDLELRVSMIASSLTLLASSAGLGDALAR
jgi:hypothetical protein